MAEPNDLRGRLQQCFAAVFPNLSPDQVTAASPRTVDAWDSVAHVTLLTVVEEEFGVEVPIDSMEQLGSFAQIEHYLEVQGAAAP